MGVSHVVGKQGGVVYMESKVGVMQVGSPLFPRVLSRGSLPPGISRYESLFNGILLMEEVVIKRGGLEMFFPKVGLICHFFRAT